MVLVTNLEYMSHNSDTQCIFDPSDQRLILVESLNSIESCYAFSEVFEVSNMSFLMFSEVFLWF